MPSSQRPKKRRRRLRLLMRLLPPCAGFCSTTACPRRRTRAPSRSPRRRPARTRRSSTPSSERLVSSSPPMTIPPPEMTSPTQRRHRKKTTGPRPRRTRSGRLARVGPQRRDPPAPRPLCDRIAQARRAASDDRIFRTRRLDTRSSRRWPRRWASGTTAGSSGPGYRWLSADHPDPDGFHLAIIAEVAALYLESSGLTGAFGLFEEEGLDPGTADFALFWDFASLTQKPRKPEEELLFMPGLKASNIWYGHLKSICWQQTHCRRLHVRAVSRQQDGRDADARQTETAGGALSRASSRPGSRSASCGSIWRSAPRWPWNTMAIS